LPVTVCPELNAGTGIQSGLLPASDQIIGIHVASLSVIDSIANDAIKQHATPGCVVLVAKDGKIVYYKALGYDDIDNKTALKRDAIFRIASQTKAITSVAVLMLYEEGKFQLDDPVANYIPEFRNMTVLEKFNK